MNLVSDHLQEKLASHLRHFSTDNSGSELVEYALSLSLLMMVMFGIVDGSRLVYAHHFVAQGAEAGVRYASTHGSTWPTACANSTTSNCVASAANVSSYVASTATVGISPSSLTVTASWPGTDPNGNSCSSSAVDASGCMVTVTVNYTYQFTLPFLPHFSTAMSSSASGVIQQ